MVQEKVTGVGQWLRGFLGGLGPRGPSWTCHGTPPSWLAPSSKPQPPPSPSPGQSNLDSLLFDAPLYHKIFGQYRWAWAKPLRVGGGAGLQGPGGGNRSCPGGKRPPLPTRG